MSPMNLRQRFYLVEVLAGDEPGVVQAAGNALRELTGLKLADQDLQAWRDALD